MYRALNLLYPNIWERSAECIAAYWALKVGNFRSPGPRTTIQAEDSHEISSLIFSGNNEKYL